MLVTLAVSEAHVNLLFDRALVPLGDESHRLHVAI
jgi:hypothetical protein